MSNKSDKYLSKEDVITGIKSVIEPAPMSNNLAFEQRLREAAAKEGEM